MNNWKLELPACVFEYLSNYELLGCYRFSRETGGVNNTLKDEL